MKTLAREMAFPIIAAGFPVAVWVRANFITGISPPIADPADTRFESVTEDWTSPAPANQQSTTQFGRLIAYINDRPGYKSSNCLQVQWRFGDPLDLYVMKPKGVKKAARYPLSLRLSSRNH